MVIGKWGDWFIQKMFLQNQKPIWVCSIVVKQVIVIMSLNHCICSYQLWWCNICGRYLTYDRVLVIWVTASTASVVSSVILTPLRTELINFDIDTTNLVDFPKRSSTDRRFYGHLLWKNCMFMDNLFLTAHFDKYLSMSKPCRSLCSHHWQPPLLSRWWCEVWCAGQAAVHCPHQGPHSP